MAAGYSTGLPDETAEPIVQQSVDLPLQLAGGPVIGGRFDFVERPCFGTVHFEERSIMRPR